MPSLAELEEWLEEQWPRNLYGLPHRISETVYSYSEVLYEQLTKYGPPALPNVSLPSLRDTIEEHLPSFSRIEPPPPPPPPPTRLERITGLTALTGRGKPTRRPARVRNGIRREAVVILGADTAIGRAVLMALASQGLIVIASVSNPASLRSFDSQLLPSSRGYVAVRHFEPTAMPDSITSFASEVHSTLALRFPLTAAGDPFARPGDNVTLIGIVNALSFISFPAPGTVPASITSDRGSSAGAMALSRAMDQHVVGPLAAISALLPEVRIAQKRMYSANPECVSPVTIISLVAKVGSGTSATHRMVSQAALAGADALRGEITGSSAVQSRPVRMTVLEIELLSPPPVHPFAAAGGTTFGPTSPVRPSVQRSISASIGGGSSSSTWQTKDAHTVRLQNRVVDLVLAADCGRALKKRYVVRAPTSLAAWRALAHSYVPTFVHARFCRAWEAAPVVWVRTLIAQHGARRSRRSRRSGSSDTCGGSNASSQQLVRSHASVSASDSRAGGSSSVPVALQQRLRTVQQEALPTPGGTSATPASSTPSHAGGELEAPSCSSGDELQGSSDGGGSGGGYGLRARQRDGERERDSDENGNDSEGFVLHSAPSSSADGEEDARWSAAGSPWFGPQPHSSSSSRLLQPAGAGAFRSSGPSEISSSSAAIYVSNGNSNSSVEHGSASGANSGVLGGSWVRLGDSQEGNITQPQQ
ncbi:hypothetical protein K437DRAFT_263305 [Tilletiaria anomala UBC 951]|uniref:Uncharacterized protein n=1 Tax=Tilletiaria anomala (strain ATCC 24038 / CBS 436.72 / UBC 951) TaxID=1037660 RepID=A0A066VRJ0_TILAU|nr:uncharacterized protein K437DRAFT_263305 [Tilletiaria anomala UBC 951]KDN44111.1 hypothetical protein K437DRAFT_263305 [Tilletiaria anomala UBC 951]